MRILVAWKDVDVNQKDLGGQTPLSRAAENAYGSSEHAIGMA